MFIAIVNTCSLYSLSLFVPMVSTIKSQDSRAIQTQSKECIWKSRTGIDASTTIIVQLWAFLVLHMHMDMLHKWSRSIAASTTFHIRRGSWHAQRRQRSCDTLDNLKRSCSLRCQHQGRSRPDGIARGVHESSGTVSGNASRRRKQRSRAVASALALQSTATI